MYIYLNFFIQTIFRQLFCRPPDDTFLVNYETLRRRERTTATTTTITTQNVDGKSLNFQVIYLSTYSLNYVAIHIHANIYCIPI